MIWCSPQEVIETVDAIVGRLKDVDVFTAASAQVYAFRYFDQAERETVFRGRGAP